MSGIVIRAERRDDYAAIDGVLIGTFRDTGDLRTVSGLRRSDALTLGLVAEAGGTVAGYVACVAIPVTPDPGYPVWALSSLPFLPEDADRAVVAALVGAALARAGAAGVGFVALLGDPAFYGSFGFRAEATRGLKAPWSGHYYLGRQLTDGPAPVGQARYPEPFLE